MVDIGTRGPAADGTRPDSFLTVLDMRMLPPDGDAARATAHLGPATWAKGTERPRLGALVAMADVVAGLRPTGAVAPTVDLNLQLLRPAPARGQVDMVCRPLKAGRRLFVGEVLMWHRGTPLARSVATFLNRSYGVAGSPPRASSAGRGRPEAPFDEWFLPSFPDERTVLVERTEEISNGPGATVQGGAQATVAELAAEWALAPRGPHLAVDLDIRYLGPVRTGPLAATADVVAVHDDRAFVSVRLADAGAGDALVAHATVVCRPET
jgi:acyl-coenzyme A thioesterase PaaI-like protein